MPCELFARVNFTLQNYRSDVNAGAPLSDQQMSRVKPLYPVDRYLVESSNKIEMVNILEDDSWPPEPALRPEDELMLRKLHDMLQSTAEDLKALSGELTKYRDPDVQVKALPTPLDEQFNLKLHIEEVVNAKFEGKKIIDRSSGNLRAPKINQVLREIVTEKEVPKPKLISTGVQVNVMTNKKGPSSILKKTSEPIIDSIIKDQEQSKVKSKPQQSVAYNEFEYKYMEETDKSSENKLHIQTMPSINIRSALMEQKVVQLDIQPEIDMKKKLLDSNKNSALIELKYKPAPQSVIMNSSTNIGSHSETVKHIPKPPVVRKVTKILTCGSSESTGNGSSDTQHTSNLTKTQRISIVNSPRLSSHSIPVRPRKGRNLNLDLKTKPSTQKSKSTHPRYSVDEWRNKLNSVYGTNKNPKISVKSKAPEKKIQEKKSNIPQKNIKTHSLNNAEYIPYSKLTLGGARVSDIEKEISNIGNSRDIPLSPILDKILSRENSTANSPRLNTNPKILTTSDENLLEEVLNIEKNVGHTISKNFEKIPKGSGKLKNSNIDEDKSSNKDISYDDDFEDDDKTNKSQDSDKSIGTSENNVTSNESSSNKNKESIGIKQSEQCNDTSTKTLNLSFKNTVDVFEYVHSVDTQDNATQSNTTQVISLKETQTSPRNETSNMLPIHNDLWSSSNTKREVEDMFNIEKGLIKKLILKEYGDLLEKNVSKPSTSASNDNLDDDNKNVTSLPKDTQTSPARVKTSMTSPMATKTRTTSPLPKTLTVNRETSPLVVVSNEETVCETEHEDPGISVNLSSPRFRLRLPQTSGEVLSNIEHYNQKSSKLSSRNNKTFTKARPKIDRTNSSSADIEASSSDLSSLGEVKLRLRRRSGKKRVTSTSEWSSTSSGSKLTGDLQTESVLPLKSEGELSVHQIGRSEGEFSLGQIKSEGEFSLQRF